MELKKGLYAVHHKYQPGYELDFHNYCYQLSGTLFDTQSKESKWLYTPLYTYKPGDISSIQDIFGYSFQGFSRTENELLGTISDTDLRMRFKYFSLLKSLEKFLFESRELFKNGEYTWR